eukprot:COSAG03_NODE_846_length_5642_cov_13.751218_2_plen_73_part_00
MVASTLAAVVTQRVAAGRAEDQQHADPNIVVPLDPVRIDVNPAGRSVDTPATCQAMPPRKPLCVGVLCSTGS